MNQVYSPIQPLLIKKDSLMAPFELEPQHSKRKAHPLPSIRQKKVCTSPEETHQSSSTASVLNHDWSSELWFRQFRFGTTCLWSGHIGQLHWKRTSQSSPYSNIGGGQRVVGENRRQVWPLWGLGAIPKQVSQEGTTIENKICSGWRYSEWTRNSVILGVGRGNMSLG